MGASEVYKRRRAHVQRENPRFFGMKENGAPRRRESVLAEYERLTAVSAYGRDPKAGTERPEGGVIPTTPPLKPVQLQSQAAVKGEKVSLNDPKKGPKSGKTVDESQNQRAYPEIKASTKALRRDFQDLILDAKEGTSSQSAKYLSSHEVPPQVPDFVVDENDEAFVVDSAAEMEQFIEPNDPPRVQSEAALITKVPDQWATSVFTGYKTSSMASDGGWGGWGDGECDVITDHTQNAEKDGWNTVQNARANRGPQFNVTGGADNISRVCFNCGQEGHRKSECSEAPKKSNRACHKCGEEGHIARDCPVNQNVGISSAGGGSCHKCGEEGHFARECPSNDGSGTRTCRSCGEEGHIARQCPAGGFGGGNGPGGTCHNCGEMGHFARNCPLNTGPSGGSGRGCFSCGEQGHRAAECPHGGSRHGRFGRPDKEQRCRRGYMERPDPESDGGNDGEDLEPIVDADGIAW